MSMQAGLRRIAPALAERLRAEPALVRAVIAGRTGDEPRPASDLDAFLSLLPSHMRAMLDEMAPDMRAAFLAEAEHTLADMPPALQEQIAAARQTEASGDRVSFDAEDLGPESFLDKAWHGVHFLLCGTPEEAPPPLGDAVLGGDAVGEDLGYGPARVLDPARVAAVAAALRAISADEVAGRFDAVRLDADGVYPAGWAEEGRREWLRDAYARLRAFYLEAAAEGSWVLLWLE
jgi:hypothetical protein